LDKTRAPAPAPSADAVRNSVQKGVEKVVKPFIKRVEAQRKVPHSGKIRVR